MEFLEWEAIFRALSIEPTLSIFLLVCCCWCEWAGCWRSDKWEVGTERSSWALGKSTKMLGLEDTPDARVAANPHTCACPNSVVPLFSEPSSPLAQGADRVGADA